ncbi:MAG TPA: SDR family NAD(P)-dependent oxidoreductase [Solirubrobacteraceae bacterium]|jgi:short-subunit dehydrogenase|nr:SDR family NAD(P)-dependent oxidoreductase [Solirubrobacteraceae bacterium]
MIALVTGASSGIGQATARRLAQEPGTTVVLVARREERLRALAAELASATWVAVDLVAPDAPARLRAHLERSHSGRLDLLVNCAGASWRGTFADEGWENVRKTMEVNFDAIVRLSEALLPLLRASAPSAMVNIASVAGRVGRARASAYSASKFALIGWSESLALEESEYGVHVAIVSPGFVSTEGFPGKGIPKPILSRPEVVADAVVRAGLGRKAEVYTPRYWTIVPSLRHLVPGLVRRVSRSPVVSPSTKEG